MCVGSDACVVPVLLPREAATLSGSRIPSPHPSISHATPRATQSDPTVLSPGQHSAEILQELGYTREDVYRLSKAGVLGKLPSKL